MKHKFKALGLVLAAVFAVSAVSVASASAAEQFHSAAAPTTLTGTQATSHVFTTNAGTVTCKTASFTGTQSTVTTESVTLAPTYENCTAFGFIGVKIDVNGCAYIFNQNGSTKIECPTVKEVKQSIEVTAPGCTVKVGEQTIASGMSFSTVGTTPSRHILATTDITSAIAYNECGTARTNGSYTGTTTVTGSAGEIWFL